MKSRTAVGRIVLFVTMIAGTVLIGWWVVPALGAVWGLLRRRDRRPGLEAAVAAGLSWTALLAWRALEGPLWGAATMVGGIFVTPGIVPITLTVLFPALLAGSAAAFAAWIAGFRTTAVPNRPESPGTGREPGAIPEMNG